MSRIFLSHSSKDNDRAVALRDWLAAQGWVDVFLDLDPQRGIASGDRWERSLNQAALRCEAVLFLVSQSWLASDWCLKEFNLAHRLNKRLFGLLIEDIPIGDLPATLTGTWQLVPLASGRDHIMLRAQLPGTHDEVHVTFSQEGLTRLRIGLERAGLDARYFAWPPEFDPKRAPYRGLLPMDGADAGIFFGREAPIIEALDRIRGIKDGPAPRLLVLLGASGAGKSSFLRAGLLPRLMRDDRNYITLQVIRPERASINGEAGLLRSLEAAFAAYGEAKPRAEIRRAINGGAANLRQLLQTLVTRVQTALLADEANAYAPVLVLAIDQGEELFLTEGASESIALLNLLRELLADDAPAILVVITIRSDAYEQLQTAKPLEGVTQQALSLMPMPRGAYQAVIDGPAARLNETDRPLVIEPALTQALLADIENGSGRDALPLLAFTLERLYLEYGARGRLTLKDYDALGRIKGSIEAAIERAFRTADTDARIPRDRDARLALLRRGLIPWLAGIDPDTGSPRRQKARISEIPEEARPLINLLVEQRLLSTDVSNDTGERTIEPAHESLLRQWGSLQGWLQEDFVALTNLETAKRATRDWAANSKSEDWLVHRAGRLEDAERLLQRHDLAGKLDTIDRGYLIACRKKEETERAEKTTALQRRLKLQRGFSFAALAAAVIMGAIGFYAYNKKVQADLSKAEAEVERNDALTAQSRFLARASRTATNAGDAVLGINLAIAALPKLINHPNRPFLQDAADALAYAYGQRRERLILNGPATHDMYIKRNKQFKFEIGKITQAIYSRDGSQIATSYDDGSVRVWNASDGSRISVLETKQVGTNWPIFSPDSHLLITVPYEGNPLLWDPLKGVLIGPLEDKGCVRTVNDDPYLMFWRDAPGNALFSSDGSRIVTVARGGRLVCLWNVKDRSLVRKLETGGAIKVVEVSSSNDTILTLDDQGAASLWDAKSGNKTVTFADSGVLLAAALSPDGTVVVTGSDTGNVEVWNADAGVRALRFNAHAARITAVAISPDRRLFATASDDDSVRAWDLESGQPAKFQRSPNGKSEDVKFSSPGEVRSLQFAADGATLLAVARAKISAYDLKRGRKNDIYDLKHEFESVDLSPDGQRAATVVWDENGDKSINLWDTINGDNYAVLQGETNLVQRVRFSPDGRQLLTASLESTARLWDATFSGKLLASSFSANDKNLDSVKYSADGSQLLSVGYDKAVRLWRLPMGSSTSFQHGDYVIDAKLTPSADRVVTSTENENRIYIWDSGTGSIVKVIEGTQGANRSISYISPDGGLMTVVGEFPDGNINKSDPSFFYGHIWDVETGKEIASLRGHTSIIKAVSFSPNSERIVTGSADGTARIWNDRTGELIHTLAGTKPIETVQFSQDGNVILTGSYDGTVRLWNASSGELLNSTDPRVHVQGKAAISPNNKRIAAAGYDPAEAEDLQKVSDFSTYLWDGSTMAEIRKLRGYLVGFAANGTRLVTNDRHGLIIFDATDGRELASFDVGLDNTQTFSISSDGSYVLIGERNAKYVNVWKLDGSRVAKIRSNAAGSAFSPTGNEFALAEGLPGKLSIFMLPPLGQQLIDLAQKSLVRGLSVDERGKYFLDESKPNQP